MLLFLFQNFTEGNLKFLPNFLTSNTFTLGFQTGGKPASKQKEHNTRIKDANVLKGCAETQE